MPAAMSPAEEGQDPSSNQTLHEEWRSLVARIGAGDRAAETELVLRFSRSLLFMLERRTGERESARDALQETFVVAIRRLRLGEIKRPEALAAFLRGIALNVVLGAKRTAERRLLEYDMEAVHTLLDGAVSADMRIEQSENIAMVKRAIGAMPVARDRNVLVRYFLSEEDKGEICSALGLSSEHFDRVLHRARRRLKGLLGLYRSDRDSKVVAI